MLYKTGRYYCFYDLCIIKYVRVSILERLYLSIHTQRLVFDQLLGEGPDHKNLRILFDLGDHGRLVLASNPVLIWKAFERQIELCWQGVSSIFVS